jgi:hypothetical protein
MIGLFLQSEGKIVVDLKTTVPKVYILEQKCKHATALANIRVCNLAIMEANAKIQLACTKVEAGDPPQILNTISNVAKARQFDPVLCS